jgi:ubiquinone/menaquinone biosynthesis C-methylase UbiE
VVSALRRLYAWALVRLYYEFAPIYDFVAMRISRGHWFLWGEAVIPFLTAPILELGCGTGHLQASLAHHGLSAIGLDRSPAMLRQARRRSATLILADSQAIPLRPASMQTVVAIFPAPYIIAPDTRRQIAQVLQPGGRLVVLLAAGTYDITRHPLWQSYAADGWQVSAPALIINKTPLQLMIATPPHATPS